MPYDGPGTALSAEEQQQTKRTENLPSWQTEVNSANKEKQAARMTAVST